jgi:hypothetical protein
LISILLLLFIDAARHVFLGWRAYFRWQMSLDRSDRAPARFNYGPGRLRLREIVDVPVEDAPVETRERYRHNARWFLGEAAAIFVIGAIGVIVGNSL